MSVLSVFGKKTVAIMMAPVVNPAVSESVIDAFIRVSDRHLEMLGQALDVFGSVPDYDLSGMVPNASRRVADTLAWRKAAAFDPNLETLQRG
ncbi:hypothetical protein V6767_18900 [Martelella sp. FLE1502]